MQRAGVPFAADAGSTGPRPWRGRGGEDALSPASRVARESPTAPTALISSIAPVPRALPWVSASGPSPLLACGGFGCRALSPRLQGAPHSLAFTRRVHPKFSIGELRGRTNFPPRLRGSESLSLGPRHPLGLGSTTGNLKLC